MESNTTSDYQQLSRFKRSWLLTKAAWNGFKMDKEMIALPIISTILTFVVVIVFIIAAFLLPDKNPLFDARTLTDTQYASSYSEGELVIKPLGYALMVIDGALLSIIGTLTSAAVIHAALARFKGQDPTIRSSLRAVFKKFWPLSAFSIFAFTIGIIISEIANRIPFLGGKIVAWLADLAWNVASFFALAVIVDEQQPHYPIAATKKSISLIRKTWGESLIASASIGLISVLIIFAQVIVTIGFVAILASVNAPGIITGLVTFALFMSFIISIFVFSVLTGYVKAALYYFAITGESPAAFNSNLMHQAFTHKKARKLFSA